MQKIFDVLKNKGYVWMKNDTANLAIIDAPCSDIIITKYNLIERKRLRNDRNTAIEDAEEHICKLLFDNFENRHLLLLHLKNK